MAAWPTWLKGLVAVTAVLVVIGGGFGVAAIAATDPAAEASAEPAASPTPEPPLTASASPSEIPTAAPSASSEPSPTPQPTSSQVEDEPTELDTSGDPFLALSRTESVECTAGGDGSYTDIASPYLRGASNHAGDADHIRIAGDLGRIPAYEVLDVAWSPDSSTAAVVTRQRETKVWLVEPDGTAVHVSEGLAVEELSPVRWAPDGSGMLFVAVTDGGDHALQWVDTGEGTAFEIARGNRAAGYDIAPNGDIYVAWATGRHRMAAEPASLMRIDSPNGAESFVAGAAFPSVSPDGATLAVFGDADRDGAVGATLIDLETGTLTPVGPDVPYDGYLTSYFDRHTASWSPDGSRVAGVTGIEANRKHTQVVLAAANGDVLAVEGVTALYRPAWTANSAAVAATDGFTSAAIDRDGRVTRTVPPAARGPIAAEGSTFVWRAALCGESVERSLSFSADLASVGAVPTAAGWVDAGLPHTAPDGSATLRALAHVDGSGTALYLTRP
ncbi:hypothetical protein [Demequina sp. NBRC 110056]|uniref:hypothetical protein n=1 Tax=Demequina sp. NBRC 110056 TaxID=1570345 RepID=UPI0011800DC4|nr:hypothetical protein [Demequina sp. NBRC 110056]